MKRGSRVLVAAMTCAMLAPAAPALGAAGGLDPSFGGDGLVTTNLTPGNDAAKAVAMQADGKIVVAGRTPGGHGQIVVARYTTAGLLDPAFSGDGIVRTNLSRGRDEATAVAIQPDGKIVVSAAADAPGTNGLFAIVRYDPDGRLDPTFSRDGRVVTAVPGGGRAAAIAIAADGRIVAAGTANAHLLEFAAVRYMPDGALDTTFGGDGTVVTPLPGSLAAGQAVAVQPNGRVVVAGFAGGAGRYALVRYTPSGVLDTTFSGNGKAVLPVGGFADAVALDGGKIVLAGGVQLDRLGVVRVNGDGTLDRTFGSRGVVRTAFRGFTTSAADAVAIQADGKIVAAGFASNFRGPGAFALARYTPTGALDTTFGGDGRVHTAFPPGGADEADGVAIQTDGRIVAAGRAAGLGGRLALARYLG